MPYMIRIFSLFVDVMGEQYDSDLQELCVLSREPEPTVKFVQTVVEVVHRLLKYDLGLCLQKEVDIMLWEIMKNLISELRKAKDNSTGGFNMCVGWLMNIFHVAQFTYNFGDILHTAPLFLVIDDILLTDIVRRPLEPVAAKIFTSFITLRLGDLFRYKNELDQAVALYQFSLKCDAVAGSAWNQLAIISQQRLRQVDELYLSTRALLCEDPFQGASTNINTLLRKFSTIEPDLSSTSLSLRSMANAYLCLVARFHFLLPVPDNLISLVVTQMCNIKYIVPILAIFDRIGDSDSKDEIATRERIIYCLQAVADNLEKIVPLDTDLLCLLLRVNCIRFSLFIDSSLSQFDYDTELTDDYQLENFECLENPFHYPISIGDLISVINERSESG